VDDASTGEGGDDPRCGDIEQRCIVDHEHRRRVGLSDEHVAK
jgi:hypothetical protein